VATITPTLVRVNDNTIRFTYTPMLNTDVGAPIGANHADFTDRGVSVRGTFGAGGNCQIQGSDDNGSNYSGLNDAQGTILDITTAKREQILEVPELTRPNITAGDGATSLTVVITVHRPRSGAEPG
jgi:hypothetical protein